MVATEISSIFYLYRMFLCPNVLACSRSHLSSGQAMWQADKSALFYQQETNISSLI